MNFTSFTNAFDLFASCYVYGCLTYIAVLFIVHLYCSLLADCKAKNQINEVIEPDFYTQVKDLFNPLTEDFTTDFAPSPQPPQFQEMTIRELRSYIKDNQLHHAVRVAKPCR